MIDKHIKDVVPDDVLAEDIIHEDLFLIKKGTVLSKRLIRLLRIRDINTVKIKMDDQQPESFSNAEEQIYSEVSINSSSVENKAKASFFQSLSFVGYEHRYGKILNQDEDVQLLIELFTDIYMNEELMNQLHALKKWDHYTFIHSFDIFVLGILLAKRQGIEQLHDVALGYLFHDIGKIEISQDILSKKGKLTFKEFDLIKKHTIKGEAILHAFGQDHIAHYADHIMNDWMDLAILIICQEMYFLKH